MSALPAGWYVDPADPGRHRWWDGQSWSAHVAQDGRVWDHALSPVATMPRRRRRMPVWAWVVISIIGLMVAALLAPVIAPIALVVLITGIVGLTKGSRTWLRLKSRKAALGATSIAAAALLFSGAISGAALSRTTTPDADAIAFAATETHTATARPSTTPTPKPSPTHTPVTTTREEVQTETIAFVETHVDDPSLASGQTVVRTTGQNGTKTLTYEVQLVDGVEVSRALVSDVTTTAPIDQVIAVGTYVAPAPAAPAPAAPAGGCDSNYADACVPIASDVDCASGSGNGPAYFDGIARVVGQDIYDLDRDHDGYACEPN